jgi:hypothetical protein
MITHSGHELEVEGRSSGTPQVTAKKKTGCVAVPTLLGRGFLNFYPINLPPASHWAQSRAAG